MKRNNYDKTGEMARTVSRPSHRSTDLNAAAARSTVTALAVEGSVLLCTEALVRVALTAVRLTRQR